ncbi:argininosuccinate synthase [Buchnera aphidicola]|uniref:argininosuccinate synthase n=1 Tax=Buchnera aphidicola TaxID=9 RepID=UPI003464C6C0
MNIKDSSKVVLAYSGGLDTSVIIPWIKENYSLDVIAFVADLGQSKDDLNSISDKAFQSGASDCFIIDLKKKFVEEYIFPVLSTGALYEGSYLLGTAMARPLIAKEQVKLALSLKAIAVCHGATGKGNDQVRFETAYASLAPQLQVIAPWREWNFSSREDLIEYLKVRNIPSTATVDKIYSRDENIWHISTEGGILEEPWNAPNKDCWIWTTDPVDAPNIPEFVSIQLDKGCPVAVNDQFLDSVQCLSVLNSLASKHGIGRIDIVENRLIGMKSRGCYETPGGTLLVQSIRAIEQLVLDRDSFKWREKIGLEMSSIVYNGLWFSPVCESIKASARVLFNLITGKVVLKLYKGHSIVVQKKSKNSLYSQEFATFGCDDVYDQNDSKGFINLFSLSSKIRAMKNCNKI